MDRRRWLQEAAFQEQYGETEHRNRSEGVQGLQPAPPPEHLSMLNQDADRYGVPPSFPFQVASLPQWRNDPPGLREMRCASQLPFQQSAMVAAYDGQQMLGSPQPHATSSPFSGFAARSVPPPGFTATLLREDDDVECGVDGRGAGLGVTSDRRADHEREHDNAAKGRCGDASHEFGRYEQCGGGHVPTVDTSNPSRPAAERSGHATPTQGQRADAGDVTAAAVLQQPSPFAPATVAGAGTGTTGRRRGHPPAATSTSAQAGGCADGSTVMQSTDAGGVRGRAGAQAPPAQKKVKWSLEECLALARIQREDDALMADASSVHKLKKHGEKREWIARRMRDEGWNRSAEDCRKKWFTLGQKLKVLADKVGRSGKPGYFDMTVEERGAEGLYANFDRRLGAEMDWILQKPSGTCDNTLNSDSLNAKDGDNSARGSSDRGGSDRERSDVNVSAGKTRRTSSGRVNDGDGPSSMSGMSVALAESTRVYVDGLDRVAATIAEAQTAGATMVAGRLGDMATKIGAVATAMTEGNVVLQLLVGVMASQGPRGSNSPREARGGRDNDPSSL
ncbi:hypothetical protein CBR_g38881 [Chara braunii]|uniref:Myb/SANT-like DNA-binding domain-containing protein n=1 Tax=Chara braunii TaxID=69332 RepID=A0A388LQI4_CHABU|nr:hypothetical protein CBR_g38881 [Chara braunii]|eukprot:GBG84598.1 hypothetical protein CBR_g38881 [Chara braunii]